MEENNLNEIPGLTPEWVQQEIRRTRHNKELALYGICSAIGVLSVLGMIASAVGADSAGGLAAAAGGDLGALAPLILMITGFITGIGYLIAMSVWYIISLYQLYANQMAYSVKVSEKNFPEIYQKVQEYSQLLGMRPPEVYVQQMNGELNAFTCWVPGKTFIQLNAEVVDVAYMEHRDLDPVLFILAHEMGHAYLHHVQLQYNLWPMLVVFIPFVGPVILNNLLSRAREYSSDRVAQALTGGKAERETMMLLSAGRHLYKYLDTADYYVKITVDHNAIERLARWVANLLASHPIMPFRVRAILDPSKKSGRLL